MVLESKKNKSTLLVQGADRMTSTKGETKEGVGSEVSLGRLYLFGAHAYVLNEEVESPITATLWNHLPKVNQVSST